MLEDLENRFTIMFRSLPKLVGNEVVNFALDNWKKKGFQGASFQPWAKRKSPTAWGTIPPRNGRSILVLDGHLRRSIKVQSTTADSVTVGTDSKYAQVHNEGSTATITQHIPQHTRKLGYKDEVSKPGAKKEKFVRIHTGSTTVQAHTRTIKQNIPQRQFLAPSPVLDKSLEQLIENEIKKALT